MNSRDEFAAAALTGLLTQRATSIESPRPELAAQVAYQYADAMLKEREIFPEVMVRHLVKGAMQMGYELSQKGIPLQSGVSVKTQEELIKSFVNRG